MEKHVVKFGKKYLKSYVANINTDISQIELTDEIFKAREIDRKDYVLLNRLIEVGADIVEVTFFESNKTWNIETEIEELTQGE